MSNEELATLIQQGHEELLPELWNNVVGFIENMAKRRYSTMSIEFGTIVEAEDFAQSGYIALVEAVKYYKPDSEYKFLTYLSKCLKTAFAEVGGYRTRKKDPLKYAVSLDEPILDDENETTRLDFLADPEDQYEDADEKIWLEELRQALDRAVSELPPKQRETLFRRYALGQTQKEIGLSAGVSNDAIRQTEMAAYRALKHKARINGLEKFVDEKKIDDLTPFFTNIGVKSFNTNHTSAVEYLAIKREELAKKFIKDLELEYLI